VQTHAPDQQRALECNHTTHVGRLPTPNMTSSSLLKNNLKKLLQEVSHADFSNLHR
jgi:hypothetical protein